MEMKDSCNRQLRDLLGKREALLVPGAANALAARIIEDTGFKAVYVTGAGVTNSFLGMPDIGLISLTELASHVGAMRDVVSLPLIVDADTGFGNPINVAHTVKVLERAGANAIQFEDQNFPKRCGHFAGKSVIDQSEMVQKIRSAVDARMDPDLVIIARTDAIASNGFEETLERAHAYVEAGADMMFIEAPRTIEQIIAIPQRVAIPHLLNIVSGGLTPMVSLEDLQKAGYSVVLYANAALQASITAMQNVLRLLGRTGSLEGAGDLLAHFEERQRVVMKPHFDALEKKYALPG
jgi:2-methylisocitrate lyase-like PEP mutase family enzyme